jgi:hypothetical protein
LACNAVRLGIQKPMIDEEEIDLAPYRILSLEPADLCVCSYKAPK